MSKTAIPQPTILHELVAEIDFLRQRMNWHLKQIENKLDLVLTVVDQVKKELESP